MRVMQIGDVIALVRREGSELRCWELSEACLDAVAALRRHQRFQRVGLTPRELEVVELLLLGRSHQEIAEHLELTIRTVRFHQSNALEKLGAETRADLPRVLL